MDLVSLRGVDSDLEGDPTPRLPFVEVATGLLGQGLSSGVDIASRVRRRRKGYVPFKCL